MDMITIFEQTVETNQIPVATRVYKEDDINPETGAPYTIPYNVRAEIDFLNTKAAKLTAVYSNDNVLSAFIQKLGNSSVLDSISYTKPETPTPNN